MKKGEKYKKAIRAWDILQPTIIKCLAEVDMNATVFTLGTILENLGKALQSSQGVKPVVGQEAVDLLANINKPKDSFGLRIASIGSILRDLVLDYNKSIRN